jgi:DNA replication protein DnaC
VSFESEIYDETTKPLGRIPAMKRLQQEVLARHKWEAANPELTALINAARDEDERRTRDLEAARAMAQFRERMPERLGKMGVPKLVIDALNAPNHTTATEHVAAWKASDRAFLLLLGGPGTGKTVAAASALIEAPAHSSVFTQAIDIARLSDFNVEHAHELDRVSDARFLVLDDLGTEHANDFWISRLDGIINHRYGQKLRTIITSNLDAERFKKQYGERIADRIRQVGIVRACGNESMRRLRT